jgi:hypothetical protein
VSSCCRMVPPLFSRMPPYRMSHVYFVILSSNNTYHRLISLTNYVYSHHAVPSLIHPVVFIPGDWPRQSRSFSVLPDPVLVWTHVKSQRIAHILRRRRSDGCTARSTIRDSARII